LLSIEERNSLARHFEKVSEHCEEVQVLQAQRVQRDIRLEQRMLKIEEEKKKG